MAGPTPETDESSSTSGNSDSDCSLQSFSDMDSPNEQGLSDMDDNSPVHANKTRKNSITVGNGQVGISLVLLIILIFKAL